VFRDFEYIALWLEGSYALGCTGLFSRYFVSVEILINDMMKYLSGRQFDTGVTVEFLSGANTLSKKPCCYEGSKNVLLDLLKLKERLYEHRNHLFTFCTICPKPFDEIVKKA
jgi:hypothetical protein